MSSKDEKLQLARQNLMNALGTTNFQLYLVNFKHWFRQIWTRDELDYRCRKLLTIDQMHLHNQFFLAILNKIDAISKAEEEHASAAQQQSVYGNNISGTADKVSSSVEHGSINSKNSIVKNNVSSIQCTTTATNILEKFNLNNIIFTTTTAPSNRPSTIFLEPSQCNNIKLSTTTDTNNAFQSLSNGRENYSLFTKKSVREEKTPSDQYKSSRSSRKRTYSSRTVSSTTEYKPANIHNYLMDESGSVNVVVPVLRQNGPKTPISTIDINNSANFGIGIVNNSNNLNGTRTPVQNTIPEQRYAAQELFLPDAGLVMGRFLVEAWNLGLHSVDDQVGPLIVIGVQNFLKNILSSILLNRKHCRRTGGNGVYFYDVGFPIKDPTLRNTHTRGKYDDEPIEMDKRISSMNRNYKHDDERDKKLQESTMFLSVCEDIHPMGQRKRSISLMDVYNTLQDRNIIPSHNVHAIAVERIIQKLN